MIKTKHQPNKKMFTEVEARDIKESYDRWESLCSIGRRYGVSNTLIKRFLKEYGYFDEGRGMQRYSIDHDAFSLNPIEDIYYWTGFIAADGCVSTITENFKKLTIVIHRQDVDLLEKLQEFLKTEKPIYYYKNVDHCSLTVNSVKIVNDLAKFNIVDRKTKIITVPQFVKDSPHVRHYWRGLVDGDGTLGVGSYAPFLGVVGTEDICHSFREFCASIDGFMSIMKVIKKEREELYSCTVLSRHTLVALNEIYRDCDTFMERKMNKYHEIKLKFENKQWIPHRRLEAA